MPVPSSAISRGARGARIILNGIDHLVIVVPELEAAIASYRGLGFTVVPGGRHPIGTHNALIAFADGAYLELIAFFEPNAQHRWYQRLQQGGGLIDICLQTDDLAGDVRAFRDAGVAIADPRPLSRVRPDGYELRWVLSIPETHGGVAPFLIEDETPRDERVPRATSTANGATGIRLVTVAVSDVRGRPAVVRARARRDGRPGGARGPRGLRRARDGGDSHARLRDPSQRGRARWPAGSPPAVPRPTPPASRRPEPRRPLPVDRTLGARLSLG